jgi:hypothetical protein
VIGIEVQARLAEEPYLRRGHGAAHIDYAARAGRFLPGFGRLQFEHPRRSCFLTETKLRMQSAACGYPDCRSSVVPNAVDSASLRSWAPRTSRCYATLLPAKRSGRPLNRVAHVVEQKR